MTNLLGTQTGAAQTAYGDLLKGYSPEDYQAFYDQTFIEPAKQALQRQIIPQIKESFGGLDEAASSSLNRALAQSATDLSTQLGQGILGQYNQTQQNRLGALGGLNSLLGVRTQEPIINQQQGLLGGILNAFGQGAGAYFGGR